MSVNISAEWDPRYNPFYILGVSCGADQRTVAAAAARKGPQFSSAGNMLLDPAARLTAELNWFPDVNEQVIGQIRRYLDAGQKIPAGVGGSLAAMNVEIYNLSLLRGARGWDPVAFEKAVSSIDTLFTALDCGALLRSLNQHRRQAGVPEVTVPQLMQELVQKRRKIRHLLRDLMNAMPDVVCTGMVTYLAEKAYTDPGKKPGAVLEDAIALYEQGIQANLSRSYAAITAKIQSCRQLSGRLLDAAGRDLMEMTSQWLEMAKPMLLRFQAGGNRYPDADKLANDLRMLFVSLHNEKQETEAARKLAEGIKKRFAYDSVFLRKVEEDLQALQAVAEQKESVGTLQKELEKILTTATSANAKKWTSAEALPMARDLMFTVFLANRKLKQLSREDKEADQLRELLALAARSVAVELHNKSSMTQLAYDMLSCILNDFTDLESVRRKLAGEAVNLMQQLNAMKSRGMWYCRDTLPLTQIRSLAEDTWQLQQRRLYRGDGSFADACQQVARSYEAGDGVGRDPEKARDYYSLGSDAGNVRCSIAAALLWDQGTDPRSKLEAHKRYTLAVQQGTADNRVFVGLGVLYMNGTGIGKDYTKAGEMFRRAGDREKLALLEQRIREDKAAEAKKKRSRAGKWAVALVLLALAAVGGLYAMHNSGIAAYKNGEYQTAANFLMFSPFDDTVFEYCTAITELQKAAVTENPGQYLLRAKTNLQASESRDNAKTYLRILESIEQEKYQDAIAKIEALPAEQADGLGAKGWKQILTNVLEAVEPDGIAEEMNIQYYIHYLQDPVPYDPSVFMDILDTSRSAIRELPENEGETVVGSLSDIYVTYGKAPRGKILIVKQTREYESSEPSTAVSFELMAHLPMEYVPRTADEVAYVIVVSYDYQRDPEGRYNGPTAALQELAVVTVYSMAERSVIHTSDTVYGAYAPRYATYYDVPPRFLSGGRPKAGEAFVQALEILIK